MLCIRPFRRHGAEFGCGQCKACRVNRRNMMTGRMMLELTRCDAASFVTLTYRVDPEELSPDDLKGFVKRLRYYVDRPFRYYGVGEYGSKGGRPHYHIALFGVCMSEEVAINKAWGLGFVHVGELNHDSAQYMCKYICKSLLEREKFQDKHPEFARMSLRPGIGAPALDDVAGSLLKAHGGSMEPGDIGDVPSTLRTGGRLYPVGKYLRGKLREKIGWEKKAPEAVVRAMEVEARSRSVDEKAVRERKRQVSYNNLEGRMRIKRGTL